MGDGENSWLTPSPGLQQGQPQNPVNQPQPQQGYQPSPYNGQYPGQQAPTQPDQYPAYRPAAPRDAGHPQTNAFPAQQQESGRLQQYFPGPNQRRKEPVAPQAQSPPVKKKPSNAGWIAAAVVLILAILALLAALVYLIKPDIFNGAVASASSSTTASAPASPSNSAPTTTTTVTTTTTNLPPGLTDKGYTSSAGMTCPEGWLFAGNTSNGHVLICKSSSGNYYLDDFAGNAGRTDVTSRYGQEFQVTTKNTTIHVTPSTLWVGNSGSVVREEYLTWSKEN